MKKYSLFTGLIAVVMISSGFVTPQMREEFKKIRSAYMAAAQLQFDVEVYSYSTAADVTPQLLSKGHVKKAKNSYYSSFMGYELLQSGEKTLMVDAEAKEMELYEYTLQKQKKNKELSVNLDSLMNFSDSVADHGKKDGQWFFSFYAKGELIEQTDVFVDENTHFVARIIQYYHPSTEDYEIEVHRVETRYKNIKTSGVNADFFSFNKYLVEKGKGKFAGNGSYKGYKVNYYDYRKGAE